MEADDIRRAFDEGLNCAEAGASALRRVWPAAIPAMVPSQAAALRDAMRSLEDGWATLLSARALFYD